MPPSLALDIAQTWAFFLALFLIGGCEFLVLWMIGRKSTGWVLAVGLVGGVVMVPTLQALYALGWLRAPVATRGSLVVLCLTSLAGLLAWHLLRRRGGPKAAVYAAAAVLVVGCGYAAFRWSSHDLEQRVLADYRSNHGERTVPNLRP